MQLGAMRAGIANGLYSYEECEVHIDDLLEMRLEYTRDVQ